MHRVLKRFISVGLVITLFCSSCLTSYGATPSGGSPGSQYNPGNWPGYGKNPTPPNDHWGVRLSVTNMTQAGSSGIVPIELGESYTAAVGQFGDLAGILKTKVWQPGNFGLKVIKLGKVNSLS